MNNREIDFLIAEKVMGWKLRKYFEDDCYITDEWITDIEDKFGNGVIVIDVDKFNPSTNIQDAWRVVEKMKRSNFSARHRFVTELQKEVTPKELKDKNQLLDLGWMIFYLTPKSICLAALKAVGVEAERK